MITDNTFTEWKPTLVAIPNNKIKKPNIPIHIFCGEAEALSNTAHQDKDKLIAAGIDWTLVEGLLPLSHVLRYCQANWKAEPKDKPSTIKWRESKSEAIQLRNEMLRHFNYAFHHHPDIKKQLLTIRQHNKQTDLIQDLKVLANIAETNAEQLDKISYEKAQSTRAIQLSNTLSQLLTKTTLKSPETTSKEWRDRAYTLLKTRIASIRSCGQYIFWKDKKKYKMYTSMHSRKQYLSSVK